MTPGQSTLVTHTSLVRPKREREPIKETDCSRGAREGKRPKGIYTYSVIVSVPFTQGAVQRSWVESWTIHDLLLGDLLP